MAVDQSFITTLKSKVKTKLYNVSYSLFIKLNNGIEDEKLKKDIVRLYSLYENLNIYNVSHTYFDETYILEIEKEYDILCGKIANKPTSNPPSFSDTGSGKAKTYSYTVDSDVVADGTTGISLPETPDNLMMVFIDGWYMSIGDGIKTKDIYFSNDSGVTAKEVKNISLGDIMYYNVSVVGTSLLTTADIEIIIL